MSGGRSDGRTGGRIGPAAVVLGCLLSVGPTARLSGQDTLPIGYGTLKRDDIVLRVTTGQVEIQILPLDESVIRLLAPDTYRSLRDLIASRRTDITDQAQRAGVGHPALVLVSFFGAVPQARFVPEDVNLTSRGRLFRPLAIVPISPAWSAQQLEARQQAMAIYLFDEGIGFREQLTVSYQGLSTDAWSHSALVLDRERARVLARVRASPSPPPGARDTTRP